MDISAVDSFQNIGGIQQPVIGQRKIEQDIRLKEGEVNILGGILESLQTKWLSGIPGLAQIPLLQVAVYSEENKEVKDNEIVFVLIPPRARAGRQRLATLARHRRGTANTLSLRGVVAWNQPAATRQQSRTTPTSQHGRIPRPGR